MDDLEAEGLRAEVRRRLFGATEHAPLRVGRYVLHEPLGRGGMGVVHAAYDPDLDRRVALKLVRPGAGTDAGDEARARRLVREAQVIARLSHPNVVTVHEVGHADGGVFIAMELIDGVTLRRWCREHSPSRRQLLGVFVEAGRGLLAAHDSGLVHRDFKPENVMVDLDDHGHPSRVRVLDFGLARLHAATAGEPSTEHSEDQAAPEHEAMTQTGTILGTPAYMAPEQRRGDVGPSSDQFAFCMALAEALLGRRPDRPDTSLDRDVELGPEAKVLPARLRRALVRGLRAEPATRWPSMSPLLTELELIGHGTNNRALSVVLGGLVLGTVGVVGYHADSDPPCDDGSARGGAGWTDPRREQVAAAFTGSDVPYAQQTWTTVEITLDDTVREWSAAVERHCASPRDPVERWWARDACLNRQARELEALVTLFAEGDAGIVEHAAEAVQALPSAARCESNPPILRLPDDPEHALRVERLRVELAVLAAAASAGRYASALPKASSVVERAHALDYGPLVAEATVMLARMHAGTGDGAEAERLLYVAIEHAEAEHHDDVVAEAWLALLEVVVLEQARIDDAERLLAPTMGALRRRGEDDLSLARAWFVEGSLRHAQGRFDDAVALHRRALASLEAQLGTDHPRLARPLHGIAKAEQGRGDPAASLEPARRALDLIRAHRGPTHPDVATHLSSVANALVMMGRPEEATADFERAARLLEQTVGAWHPRLAAALHNLGSHYSMMRRFDEALPALRRAMAIDTRTHGTDHPHAAASHYAIAMVLEQQGDLDAAEAELRLGLAALERAWGPDHPDLAYLLVALGHLQLRRDDAETALPLLERGDRLLRESLGEEHPRRVHGLHGLARARLALEDPQRARTGLEHALRIAETAGLPPLARAEPSFLLAQLLPPTDAARARTLARQAAEAFDGAGPDYVDKREAVEHWLAAPSPP